MVFPNLISCFSMKLKVLGKSLRVDHVSNYKPPKDNEDYDEITRKLHSEGCAPVAQIAERNIKKEDSRKTIKSEPQASPSDDRKHQIHKDSTVNKKVCTKRIL